MATRGKKPLLDKTVEWKCRIPQSIAAKIDLLLMNPVSGLPVYGARSELVTRLLREHLDSLGQKQQTGINGDDNIPINLPL